MLVKKCASSLFFFKTRHGAIPIQKWFMRQFLLNVFFFYDLSNRYFVKSIHTFKERQTSLFSEYWFLIFFGSIKIKKNLNINRSPIWGLELWFYVPDTYTVIILIIQIDRNLPNGQYFPIQWPKWFFSIMTKLEMAKIEMAKKNIC